MIGLRLVIRHRRARLRDIDLWASDVPSLRRDASAALDTLCLRLGLERHQLRIRRVPLGVSS